MAWLEPFWASIPSWINLSCVTSTRIFGSEMEDNTDNDDNVFFKNDNMDDTNSINAIDNNNNFTTSYNNNAIKMYQRLITLQQNNTNDTIYYPQSPSFEPILSTHSSSSLSFNDGLSDFEGNLSFNNDIDNLQSNSDDSILSDEE